eukprot:Skav228239  [mRNA]  locus=scaffold3112:94387:105822:- [translate_table: standard]
MHVRPELQLPLVLVDHSPESPRVPQHKERKEAVAFGPCTHHNLGATRTETKSLGSPFSEPALLAQVMGDHQLPKRLGEAEPPYFSSSQRPKPSGVRLYVAAAPLNDL